MPPSGPSLSMRSYSVSAVTTQKSRTQVNPRSGSNPIQSSSVMPLPTFSTMWAKIPSRSSATVGRIALRMK